MMDSPEYDTLMQCCSKFFACVKQSPNDIADKLIPIGIFAPGDLSFLSNPKNNEDQKARRIIEVTKSQVQISPQVFHEVVSALEASGPWTKGIVSELKKTYLSLSRETSEQPSSKPADQPSPLSALEDKDVGDYQRINTNLIIYKRKKIGQGAFGMVFKGMYKGHLCAVKALHHLATEIITELPGGEGMEESVRAFTKECDHLKSFQHPNIVEHWSTERHPSSNNIILVTELMDCNLRSYLSGLGKESLTSYCEVSLSKDVSSGLAYLHNKSIIHRDLCGDNILLKLSQPVPVAKISDFGMSRLLDPTRLSSTLTAVGHRMGYLPPEAPRLEAKQYDHSLDVFSLGVIMVQIVHKLETVKTAKDRSYFVAQIPHTHTLKPLISTCLQEDMRRRPTAENVCLLAGELTIKAIEHDEKVCLLGGELTIKAIEHKHRSLIGFHDSGPPKPIGLLTINDLLIHNNLRSSDLNRLVKECEIFQLSAFFDDVESYLDPLGLTPGQRTDIKDLAFRHGTQSAMSKALRLWRQPNPYAATYRALLEMLLDLKKGDIAINIASYLISLS